MTQDPDPIVRACAVADHLREQGIPVTKASIEATFRALDCTPPNPYTHGLTALRAATATPESTFEDRWKAERLAALSTEHRDIAASIAAAPQPRLTAAQVAEFAPPNSYQVALAAMKEDDQ